MKNCLLRSRWNFGGRYQDLGKCISGMVLVGTPHSWSMDLYSMSLHPEKGPHLAMKCVASSCDCPDRTIETGVTGS